MMAPAQAAFVAELSRAFATREVSLIAVPVPGRAAIRHEVLHLADPRQAAFSPDAARASYDRYLEALRREGVSVVDILAVARAFDATGGQTFFKRDLHWTPEGANAVAQETASIIRGVLKAPLSSTPLKLTRSPHDKKHPGRFVNNWLQTSCGYALPPEPLGDYTVVKAGPRAEQPGSIAKVVQAGSSFSAAPFDIGFLSVALQSDVLNVSVGNGGALLALESYLATNAYQRQRPQVLVWEYPVFWSPLATTAQRRLLAGAYGPCPGEALRFNHTRAAADGVIQVAAVPDPGEHYLTLAFTDRNVLHFSVVLRYRDGRGRR
jgi:alginate biosynthesis protein AlgX